MKIALIGYGKMGKMIEQIAKDRGQAEHIQLWRGQGKEDGHGVVYAWVRVDQNRCR